MRVLRRNSDVKKNIHPTTMDFRDSFTEIVYSSKMRIDKGQIKWLKLIKIDRETYGISVGTPRGIDEYGSSTVYSLKVLACEYDEVYLWGSSDLDPHAL